MAGVKHVWLTVDPHPNSRAAPRIAVQDRPFAAHDYPPGHGPAHGEVWEVRELDVDAGLFTRLLAGAAAGRGGLTVQRQQEIHAEWWDAAAPAGAKRFEERWDRQVRAGGDHEPRWRRTVAR